MVGAVEQLPEFAPRDPGRAVRPAADGLQGLAFRELYFGGLEGRRAEHVGEDDQPPPQVLLQDVQRGGAALAADPDPHVRSQEFELFVDLIAGHAGRPARAHDGAGQGGEPDLLGRLIDGARPDHGRHGHQRQLQVRQEIDDDPVLQDNALDLRYREFHRFELHGAGIAGRGCELGARQSGREKEATQKDKTTERPNSLLHGMAFPAVPSGLTSVATTRLLLVKYVAATRRMSSGVTLAMRSRRLNVSRQSPLIAWK